LAGSPRAPRFVVSVGCGRAGSAHASKGAGGWWRIAKNAFRFLFRVHERPLPINAWSILSEQAGFSGIETLTIIAEAGLVSGRRVSEPFRW